MGVGSRSWDDVSMRPKGRDPSTGKRREAKLETAARAGRRRIVRPGEAGARRSDGAGHPKDRTPPAAGPGRVDAVTIGSDRHGHGHVPHLELVDGLHAEIL